MRALSVVAALAAIACGGGDPLEDAEHIAGWANSASALGVFAHGYDPVAIADGEAQLEDPACPSISDDGEVVEIAGDCTEAGGQMWTGAATVTRLAGGYAVALDEFGHAGDPDFLTRASGTMDIERLGDAAHEFRVALSIAGGVDTEIEYTGTVEGGYDGPTVWNGSGVIRRDSIAINSGAVEAETRDQLRDDEICPGQGISGQTTLTSDEHVAVITYDGATDCDEDEGARWSLDGVDQGVVEGITCAAGGNGGGFAGVLVLAALLLRKRRRNRAGCRAARTPPGRRGPRGPR